jgi:lysophospholipase L1-like esterase
MAAMANVSITAAFGAIPSTLTGHAGSRTTSYFQAASTNVSAASMTAATKIVSWYYISGMEVMADSSAKAIVALGDSLTDGRGTIPDQNDRWTDDLEARLQANAATKNIGMLNMGIGGTPLVGTTGTAAQARFARDVLGQAGVRYLIIFDGVNDIGGGATEASMQMVYANMISQARGQGMLVYGATITPFGTNAPPLVTSGGYYTAPHEMVRQAVNTYIKGGAFDSVFDFDMVVTDNASPPALQSQYDTMPASTTITTDGLHLNPTGYQALATSVDLTQFTK